MTKITFVFALILILQQNLNAQVFSYKTTEGVQQVDSSFNWLENNQIEFEDINRLKIFSAPDQDLKSGRIDGREFSEAEKIVSVGLMLLTALVIIPIQQTYDLGADLKMLSMRGLIFFIFPFERHYLYRTCNGVDHLVAISGTPSEEISKRMLALEDLKTVCDPVKDEESPSES